MAAQSEIQVPPDGPAAATSSVITSGVGPSGIFPDLLPTADQISAIDTSGVSGTVNQAVTDCQTAYTSSVDAINAHISECMNDCRMGAATCIACILGQIERETGLGQSVIAKCWDKVGASLANAVADSWKKSIAAGVQPPTEAQFQAYISGQPVPTSETNPSGGISAQPIDANNPPPPQQVPLPPGATLPEGSVLPVADPVSGQVVCPDSPPPFRSPNSPTGWLQIQYQPVYDNNGRVLWCVPITHIASAPTVPGGGTTGSGTGGQPTGDNTTGGSNQGTGSGTTGTQPVGGQAPGCGPGDVSFFKDDPALQTYISQYPGAIVLDSGLADTNGRPYVCVHLGPEPPIGQPSPPTEQPPPEPITPATPPPSLSVCDPEAIYAAVSDFTKGGQPTGDITAAFKNFFGVQGDCPDGFFKAISRPLDSLACAIGGLVQGIVTSANWVMSPGIGASIQGDDCNSPLQTYANLAHGFSNFLNQWFGIVPQATLISQQYGINYRCQYIIPEGGQALAARSGGYLTQEQAEFVWRCQGLCVPWQNKLLDASYNRIGIQDAYRLFKLGKLSDSEFLKSWQRNRINTDTDLAFWNEALQQYPGVADIIRMMVRDIADPSVIETLGLDAEFTNKWQGFLQQWGNAQGVNDDIAKAFWMAHWQNPSPQQVFDWLHRLRPDDRDPNDPNANIIVDTDKARKLLQIADYVPGLINAYIATSYRPLTRVDVRRMYVAGALPDTDSVRRAYRDLGYDAINASRLSQFTEIIARPQRAALAGEIPGKEIAKAYQSDLLDQDEARGLLARAGLSDEQIDTTVTAADTRRTIASRKLRFDSLRKRYFVGEFTDEDALRELNIAGMDGEAALRTVQLWKDERAAKAKQPTVAMLCTWYGKGLIDLAEYYRRVRNLNFSEVDAQRVVQICQLGITEHRTKEFEKEQARIAKEEKARNRERMLAEKAARAAVREAKLRHRLERKEVTKTTDKDVTQTVTETRTDKPDDNVTDIVQVVTEHKEQPPAP